MALGGATKKLQQVVDMAEELYSRLDRLRGQVEDVRERVERTDDRVERIERDMAGQQALLSALAEREGLDVDAILTEAAIDEAEGEEPPAEGNGQGNATPTDPDTGDAGDGDGPDAASDA